MPVKCRRCATTTKAQPRSTAWLPAFDSVPSRGFEGACLGISWACPWCLNGSTALGYIHGQLISLKSALKFLGCLKDHQLSYADTAYLEVWELRRLCAHIYSHESSTTNCPSPAFTVPSLRIYQVVRLSQPKSSMHAEYIPV